MELIVDYDNFFLPANNLDVASNFYQEMLGLETKFDFPDKGMTAFKVGNNEPALILSSRPQGRPAIWFKVDSVMAAYEALVLKGVAFLSAPFEIMTGLAVEFSDPFGNKLGLTDYSKVQAEQ